MFSPVSTKVLNRLTKTAELETEASYKSLNLDVLSEEQEQTEENGLQLAVDVSETDKFLHIMCPLSGISISDVSLVVDGDMLTITGESTAPMITEKDEDVQFHIKEVNWGTYTRSIILPPNIRADQIKARYINSILIIEVPKMAKVKSKTIKIDLAK
jgi:HSP20 family protein